MRKKPITATKKEKNNLKKKKKEVCTGTDGMTKMTKKTPTKMMKIADTGMDIGTDTETDSVKTTPVKNLKNLKNLKKTVSKRKKEKTKLSLSLKKKTSKNNQLNRKKTSGTKLNAHMHLIPADVVVKLVVDFLYDHNLCHCNHCSHPIDQRSTII
jgi:hypothetical protein